nr:hypothetical protein [Tanacetum cinerariifolium]
MSRIRGQVILRTRSNFRRRYGPGLVSLEKTRSKEDVEEIFTISHERPDQYMTVGATLTTNYKQLLADILWENIKPRWENDPGKLGAASDSLRELMLPSESKDCYSNINAARLKLKVFKNIAAAEEITNPKEKMYSYAIRLKFNASNHAMDCKALLTGLAVSVSKGMKDLHVFMDSPKLVFQTKGNNTPATEQERKYKKEIMDATTPFHRKYRWVSKQDYQWKRQAAARREKAASNTTKTKPNYNREASGSN